MPWNSFLFSFVILLISVAGGDCELVGSLARVANRYCGLVPQPTVVVSRNGKRLFKCNAVVTAAVKEGSEIHESWR